MDSFDRHESGRFSAFITGALVGAGIALLFAPKAGSQMRGILRDYATRANDELDDAIDHGSEAWNQATQRGQEFVEKGKESLRETARQAKGFAETGRATVSETTDEMAS
ncbi:MAG TPA: YtxH domain-containing protein [Nitrospiraceae bacterium]|nr:YtxH domain-containing protein [Nitrospiraceae bacterium]